MLKSMGERTPPCETPDLNWRFVDEWFLNVVYAMRPLMLFAMYLSMVCVMLVCGSLSINVCMLLMSNATAIVRVGGMGWLKPVATVLLMLCSSVLVECLVLNPCCVVKFGMFCVIYGRITFSTVFEITDRRDIGLYDVPMLMSLLGLGTGLILANFHTCGILLSLSAALYMFIWYFSTSLPMCLRCFMLMLSGPVELLFLLLLIAAWT